MANKCDVVVIGAGPAGAVAATRLIQDGLTVMVLEKMEFPRFVIGESLLPQCMDYLEKVDLLECVKKKEFQVKTGVTFYYEQNQCEFLFKDRYTDGWSYTYQVKREDFDFTLIKEAQRKGVEVRFKSEVTNVVTSKQEQCVTFKDENGKEQLVFSRFVIDASGFGRVLPRMFKLEKPALSMPRGSVFAHVEDKNRNGKASENIFVHAFNNNTAWIWAIPFSDNSASVGVVGEVDFINSCSEEGGKEFKTLVKTFPGMNERFKESDFLFEPKKILNYSISVEKMYGEGFVLCGNSTEFLDPIFSSGVTLAVSSGYHAADLLCKQFKGNKVDWERDYVTRMEHGIDVFRSYVNAWYSGDLQTIFFVENGSDDFKRQICSVLAGYVWDVSNPFVKKHNSVLQTLAKVISISN